VVARPSQIARTAGAPLATQSCAGSNFLMVVSPAPEPLLRKWFHHSPQSFDDDEGIAAIKRIIATD
jgi:hypothetical protein